MKGPWLIGCEESGTVTAAFRARGVEAYSCDLQATAGDPAWHLQMDVFEALASRRWRGAILFPDCTYLTVSGLHWNSRVEGRAEKTANAIAFARRCIYADEEFDVDLVATENPVGCLSTEVAEPHQIIQPFSFGDNASKTTCLWLRRLPRLRQTGFAAPRMICQRCGSHAAFDALLQPPCPSCGSRDLLPRWANQTDSGQNKLGPSDGRAKMRSRTYPGIANAMASQWGHL